jgi:ABC-2 type transport system ATP-binding protein
MADPGTVATAEPVIQVRGVAKRWGATQALAGATCDIGPGVTGLLGANGAGKTTLLELLLGLNRPDSGGIRVLGYDPAETGAGVRARIGFSPEHHRLPGDTRAHDFVGHLARIHGLPERAATNRASDALWAVGLGEERFRPIGTMSTGQRQRVKLAQAIAHDPAIVLLDEPTDGLDPVQRDDMLALIRRIGTDFGIHVVISSHLLEEVERICDSAIILREGRVLASGAIEELTGKGRGVLVEVDAKRDEIAALLRAHDLSVAVDGTRMVVSGPPEVGLDEVRDRVRDAVAEANAGITRLSERTTSLEDVFLEVGG